MRTFKETNKAADAIATQLKDSLNAIIEGSVTKATVKALATKSAQEVVDEAARFMEMFATSAAVCKADGFELPKFIYNVKGDEKYIDVSIRSKLKVVPKYSKSVTIAVNDDMLKAMGDVVTSALFEMFYAEVAKENIVAINEHFEALCKEAEVPYVVKFAVSDAKGLVVGISDTEVVLNASVSEALNVASYGIIVDDETSEYYHLVAKQIDAKITDALKTAPTTVQFIKTKVDIVKTLTGISTKKHASKLIREAYHRNARYLNGVKAGIAYYEETVGDKTIFALVEKTEDGEIKTVLTPFDEATLLTENYDVVAAVKAM